VACEVTHDAKPDLRRIARTARGASEDGGRSTNVR
jgi:hypothetical protein